jgi:polar amino acid transport system ATP-binding protein
MKLEIKQLKKSFGSQRALFIDHLLVADCGTLVILGSSGGGKSTLLRMIAGLSYPDSGSIAINDEEIIFKEKELHHYRKSIGVVFQSWNLFPHLTALENIVLPLVHVQGKSKEEATTLGIDLLKRFDLDKHAGKKPYALSGGQVQRVALIRAVAIHPKLLILDEPTSALDPLMTSEVLDLVLELKKEKRDLLIVTHQLHFAKRAADQVLFISKGQVLEKGSTDEVFNHPKSPEVQHYMDKVMAY